MTPEAQRIAIAEACGWTEIHSVTMDGPANSWWEELHGTIKGYGPSQLPDYLNDLNAMHEACLALGWIALDGFAKELRRIVVRDNEGKEWPDSRGVPDFFFYNATAAQRAEAFLRCLNLWKEDA